MVGRLLDFSIYDLWGEKDVHLKFHDNNLILVGENGSGKTTILRILYETLACKWTMLSVEVFSRACFKTIKVTKPKYRQGKQRHENRKLSFHTG